MLPELVGKKVVLISSAGGHLAELVALGESAMVSPESLWVAPETAQTRSLLHGRRTLFVPYVGPRDAVAAWRGSRRVAEALRLERFDYSVSTGAAIAAFTLPLTARQGIRSIYIESLARSYGPSMTGHILRRIPTVRTFTQSPSWSSIHWPYAGTVIDEYTATAVPRADGPLRIFVTLGTIRPYRFDRAVEVIRRLLGPKDTVVWQLGSTQRDDLPGEAHIEMTAEAVRKSMTESDVVIAHAGVGSLLDALAVGRSPLVLVRRHAYREHVDDHQTQLAEMLAAKGLGRELSLEAPQRADLVRAAATSIRRTESIRVTGA